MTAMWLPFQITIADSLLEVPDLELDLSEGLEQASEGAFFDAPRATIGESAIFGKMAWLIARGQALEIIRGGTDAAHLSWPLPVKAEARRLMWRDRVLALGERARLLADLDYTDIVEPMIKANLYSPATTDIDGAFSIFDVFQCFVVGADRLWRSLRMEGRLTPWTDAIRTIYVDALLPRALEDGAWTLGLDERYPFRMEHVQELTVPWLPRAFWWRHLPEHLQF